MSESQSPLKIRAFRNAWAASVLTNLGLLIQGVGVAWVMVEIASRDAMVAWVQAATSLPLMLFSIPAGAVADVFDRRKVALSGLLIALLSASALLSVSITGRVTPELLLALCFLTGSGIALYDPAWQASVPSLVPADRFPQAIALRSISQNLARSVGPAVGGVLVAWKGGSAAFLCTALLFIPLMFVLYRWDYQHPVPRLPPERVPEAVKAGIRFVKNSPLTRVVVLRGFLCGMSGVGILALMPLAARYNLDGGAIHYGVMLASFGAGAVVGAANLSRIRDKFGAERLVSYSMVAIALGAVAMATLPYLVLVSIFLVFSGLGWMIVFATLNIRVQMAAPRWVMGRALATYGAATTGGMVLGSLFWGVMVQVMGITPALFALALFNVGASFLGIWLRLPDRFTLAREAAECDIDVPVSLPITDRSGPVSVENEYRVDPADARAFYRVMQKIGRIRKRNGSYNWTLSRDLTDAWTWVERYHLSTWLDFRRSNARSTERDVELLEDVLQLQEAGTDVVTRYWLQRPMGSVRWRDEVVDLGPGGDTRPGDS